MGTRLATTHSSSFNAKGRKTTLIQCYAPTNAATDGEKEDFYSALQAQIDKSPKRDIKIVMGDMNAKVGTENKERELTMGKNGIGIINENGELFADFCAFNDLIIGGGTIFSHNTTWTSPDGKTKKKIDYFTVSRKWRRSLMDVRAKQGADAASDHQLVVAILKLKLKSYRDRADKPHFKFNTTYHRCPKIKEDFNCATWAKIEDRKEIKQKINKCKDEKEKINLRTHYCEVNRMVRKCAKEDERQFIHEMIEEVETAARQEKMKRLYEVTRTLSGKNINPNKPVKDKVGNILTSDTE
ncbi:craniofacial development protein 2-like [Physella acuta]|uniref:craniofacial development protein 2-like n=1 Tax=Physella acuta TaxID=109671 RepID=UPI0027DDAD90|nr:craniofacial development protein 2-like [Physella acuta]